MQSIRFETWEITSKREIEMENVTIEKKAGKLVITIDPKKRLRPSKSGKTTLVASTGGAALIEGIKLNVTAYVPIGE
jgi:hypothetical protein